MNTTTTPTSHAYWQALAEKIVFEHRSYINDAFVDAQQGGNLATITPATGNLLANVTNCDEADAELATNAARQAFQRGEWSHLSPSQRKVVLLKLADLMQANKHELALLDTLDMGKPITSALGDIGGAINCLRYTAESIDKLYGEVAPTGDDHLGLIVREPLGVVASIVPWNFPLMMTTWKIAPALAAGNCVIL